jgi:hypothetical protein
MLFSTKIKIKNSKDTDFLRLSFQTGIKSSEIPKSKNRIERGGALLS